MGMLRRVVGAVTGTAFVVGGLVAAGPTEAVPEAASSAVDEPGLGIYTVPLRLREGAAPHVAWVSGTIIHNGSRDIRLPLPRAHDVDLLMQTPGRRGWVIEDQLAVREAGRSLVYRFDGRRLTLLASSNGHGYPTAVAEDRRHVITVDEDRVEADVAIVGLRGASVSAGSGDVLAVRGGSAVLSDNDADPGGTYLWAFKEGPSAFEPITERPSVFADLGHDVLFLVDEATGMVGPTSISDPGEPAWWTFFEPRSVAPHGELVLGTDGQAIQVRSMDTGELQLVVAPDAGYEITSMRWERGGAVLAAVGNGARAAIVRCIIDAGCRRVTDWKRWVDLASRP